MENISEMKSCSSCMFLRNKGNCEVCGEDFLDENIKDIDKQIENETYFYCAEL